MELSLKFRSKEKHENYQTAIHYVTTNKNSRLIVFENVWK